MRACHVAIADLRALELYASILERVFVTSEKLLNKRSSEKASADEITLTQTKLGNFIVTHGDSIYRSFIKLTRHNPSAFTRVKDNGDYKMYYHPLILHEVLMMSDLWEMYVKRVLKIAPNDVFVDVGAHIGSYAIPIAKKAQKVIAFEPNKYTFKLLTKNIAINHLTNIVTYNMAVSRKSGNLSFNSDIEPAYSRIIDDEQSSDITVLENAKQRNNIIIVNTIDLDSVLLMEDRVDWIKIDVEGHELDVLEGAIQTIHMYKPKMIIEIWPRNFEKFKAMVHSFGYSAQHIYQGNFLVNPKLDVK